MVTYCNMFQYKRGLSDILYVLGKPKLTFCDYVTLSLGQRLTELFNADGQYIAMVSKFPKIPNMSD